MTESPWGERERRFATGWSDMGDVPHWFGLLPEGCEDRGWLPFLDALTLGMDPKRKLTIPHPSYRSDTSQT